MALIDFTTENGVQRIMLKGHFDSANADETAREINDARAAAPGTGLILDAAELTYISSAGLRVVIRLKKENPGMKVVNASHEVYSIFEMVGLTDMIEVHRVGDNER